MKTMLYNFVEDQHGQDLIEYTLLLAFVCLATAALFISSGGESFRNLDYCEYRSDDGQRRRC